MTDAFIETFLAGFDDSDYPASFLQRYELLECLSHNDFGETFLVKDRESGALCVAKCCAAEGLSSHSSESDLLSKIRHAGLPVWIAEYRDERMLCVVRSYIPGRPLDQLARDCPINRAQAVSIAVQICDILTFLHTQNPPIIHRDIKPQNIIVTDCGEIVLIDFGISRTYNESAQADTLCFGTRYYAAPEQYGFAQTDSRSDIFSLGVLLGWLLTGRAELQEAKKLLKKERLSGIVGKCAAFDPKDRFQSAAQVNDALTGRALKRRMFGLLGVLLIGLFVVFALAANDIFQARRPDGVVFKEPLIEEAVRLALNKTGTEALSEQDLLAVTELRVFGDRAAADEAQLKAYVEQFVNHSQAVRRGSIASLEDLARLKNLRRVVLAYQNIADIAPLAGLPQLEYVDLHHNPIRDVSPLATAAALTDLILFDTGVTDLTALQACPRLTTLDVGDTPIESMAAFEGLDALRALVMRKAALRSLDRVEMLPALEEIYLSETRLQDLSPLLGLPRLRRVELSADMRPLAAGVEGQAGFTIIYQ